MKTYIVVDDDPRMRTLYSILIKDRDSDAIIRSAENGEKALMLAKEKEQCIIISDYQMPVMNGIELYRKLKEALPSSTTSFAFVTGSDTSELQLFTEAEGIPLLHKPFSTPDFFSLVDELKKRGSKKFALSS